MGYKFNPFTGNLDVVDTTAAAGATTQVQFNDAGAFGGDSGLTFNKTTDALSAGGFIPTSSTVPANGVYLPAANSVGVATNGQGRLFVDASGNVGVGIVSTTLWGYANLAGGTTVHRLLARQADAFLGISGTSTTAELNFGLLNALSSPTLVARISTVNTITTNNGERADLAFYTKSGAVSTVAQERLRITSAGLVGIGTSAPISTAGYGGVTMNGADGSILSMMQGGSETFRVTNATGYSFINTTGSTPILFGTAATERLRITAAGLVGIGTSAPADLLHLGGATNKQLRIDSSSSPSYVGSYNGTLNLAANRRTADGIIVDSARSAAYIGISSDVGPSSVTISTASAINTQPAARVTVNGSGNVGIGSSAPDSTLTIKAAAATTPLRVSGPSSEFARIDTSGRLLVGTSTARSNFFNTTVTTPFQIEGTTTTTSSISCVSNNASGNSAALILAKSNGASVGSNTLVNNGDVLGGLYIQGSDGTEFVAAAQIIAEVDGTPGTNDMPGRLVFSTTADGASSPTERMRITNLGVLKQSTTGAYISTTARYNEFNNLNATSGDINTRFTLGANTSDTSSIFIYCFQSGVGGKMVVYGNGNIQNTNNSYGALSDIKLKENIVDANSQWDDIKALQVRNYNLKEGQAHTQIGLVAQEVEPVSPGLVYESPDRDAEGNDLGTVTKSVNYSVLYMKAVKALQEAIGRIETLEAKVAALETA
jgi:hypothetical protein